MEQSSSSGYHHPNHKLQAQVDALRNLASSSFSKAATRTSKGYRTPSAESATISHGNLVRKNSGILSSTCKTQDKDECIAGVGIGPSRSPSVSILMSEPSQFAITTCPVLVGGYRSSSVQLEVELVERLNEIGRSNLPEKTLSRTRACQNVLDRIVLQDEHYGRLLSRIRDEFNTYVDMTSRKSPTKFNKTQGSKSWCACDQDVFEFALLKQENTVMKKRVSSMQKEIESLQAALNQARTENSNKRHHDSVDETSSTGSCPEDDQEDNLEDTQLFPAENMSQHHSRPQGVPLLCFASLPSYSDEEEEEGGYSQ
ncbi:hypothetical protein DVH05_007566 [Phytophthora capsici]|nr:hypothetical protein DVH05_023842 [Phytophthora capsici]KAG1703622.1 hypothetical protein DVH05_007566 [Phytophthora capsici]